MGIESNAFGSTHGGQRAGVAALRLVAAEVAGLRQARGEVGQQAQRPVTKRHDGRDRLCLRREVSSDEHTVVRQERRVCLAQQPQQRRRLARPLAAGDRDRAAVVNDGSCVQDEAAGME